MRVTLGYHWWSTISTLWENSYHQVHMYTSPWPRTLNLPIYLPREDLVRALRRVLSYICDIDLAWGGSVMKKWGQDIGEKTPWFPIYKQRRLLQLSAHNGKRLGAIPARIYRRRESFTRILRNELVEWMGQASNTSTGPFTWQHHQADETELVHLISKFGQWQKG